MRSGSSASRGFAYVLLLVAIAIVGVAAAGSLTLGALAQRRGAERQLLAIGAEFEMALRSYNVAGPAAAGPSQTQGPRRLEDLLRDPRAPGMLRHLRRIYDDPLTGSDQWGLVTNTRGEIVGIYSLAQGRPVKQTGFDPDKVRFENADTYARWIFGAAASTAEPSRAITPKRSI